MSDYFRDFVTVDMGVTTYIKTYADRLNRLARGTVSRGPFQSHQHVVGTKSTLLAYAKELQCILKSPKDEHEARLHSLIDKIEAHIPVDQPEEYEEGMSVAEVCGVVAASIGRDLRAYSDYLITKKLEEGL